MGSEYELKFKARPGDLEAVKKAYPENHKAYRMETTYYDTPSGLLSRYRITLRRRMENEVSVCTVKTPGVRAGSGKSRGEWETVCGDITQAVPALCNLGAPRELLALTAEGLIPICGAKFKRTAILVEKADFSVEIALDQGILTGGNRQEPLCELEVELKSGVPAQADGFARALAGKLGLTPEPASKFARARALYKGENHA